MATKFFAAIAAMMMTVATMSANNNNKETSATPDDYTLPGVTVVATGSQKVIETFGANHMKYEFNLDNMGRVSTKVSYVMKKKDQWTPIAAYSVFYGEEETVLSYAEYDNVRKTYTRNAKQVRYNAAEFPEIIRVPGKAY